MQLLLSSVVSLLLVSTLPAQARTIAERLGHPANSKLLILHADDLGVAHSVNVASLDALDQGAISSASVMVPTPWITEVAAYARAFVGLGAIAFWCACVGISGMLGNMNSGAF